MATLPYTGFLTPFSSTWRHPLMPNGITNVGNIGKTDCAPMTTSALARVGVASLTGINPRLPSRAPLERAATPDYLTKTISGTATNASTPVVGAKIRCYVTETGALVDETLTDSGGHYSFTRLEPSTQYDVLADANNIAYNKIVLTRVVTSA